jgi:hypothetical protein
MTKFLASFAALAMAAGLAIAPQAASAQPRAYHPRCPRGAHWVPAHRNRAGRWVPGHCKRY